MRGVLTIGVSRGERGRGRRGWLEGGGWKRGRRGGRCMLWHEDSSGWK